MERRSSSSLVRRVGPLGWLTLVGLCLTLPGCGGCSWWSNAPTTIAEEDKTKPKPKPDFELSGGTILPYNMTTLQTGYKPGHWSTAAVDGIANNFDSSQAVLTTDALESLDMPYMLGASQTIGLPKGQKRRREVTFFVPPRYDDVRSTGLPRKHIPIIFRLQSGDGWRTLASDLLQLRPLENYQYFFLVLSANTEPHQYWERLPSMESHAAMGDSEEIDKSRAYFVLVPPIARQIPLPSTTFGWTSTAYIVWDGLPPDLLLEPQRRAMIDWLHWGGQLIVSGPDSLAALEKSPLGPYLPCTTTATREFSPQELADFRKEWWPNRDLPLVKERWSGVELVNHEDANTLVESGGSPLVVERSVGRGRIVVTAFRLTEPEYVESVARDDSFVNALLMRRPAREYYRRDETLELAFRWTNTEGYPARGVFSPSLGSRLAFFSRDAQPARSRPDWVADAADQFRAKNAEGNELMTDPELGYRPDRAEGGKEPAQGAWDDFSGVSTEARNLLIQAAGIKVPDRSFVVLVMGVYLIILVPLNWMIFRAINRVEWAWAAAPVITICYALAVVKLAEVNVGFSRPRNDVAVIEVQQGYPRAHLTRYTTLYASLFTSYNLKFDDPSAVVQPFADGRRPATWQARPTLIYARDNDSVSMSDFQVASNSLSMLHSEQMFEMGGTIDLDVARTDGGPNGDAPVYRVTNNSRRTMRDVQVFGPAQPGAASSVQISVGPLPAATPDGMRMLSPTDVYFELGTLEPGQSKLLEIGQAKDAATFGPTRQPAPREPNAENDRRRRRGEEIAEEFVDSTSVSESTSPAGTTPPATGPVETPAGDRSEFTRARMEGLWRVARETRPAQEWRLIAWSDEVIPGMDATPTPQVHREANLFVVHLADEPRPQPQPDTKPRSTVPQEENEALNLEAPMDPNAALPALPGALPVPIPAPQ